MILGFDIGNTNTKAAVYDNGSIVPQEVFRYKTVKTVDGASLSEKISNKLASIYGDEIDIDGIAVSSVVPEVNDSYRAMGRDIYDVETLIISCESRLSITLNYTDPRQLGVDRFVNAEAAYREYGGRLIIIDIGTAATFCVLLENGDFDGGIIAPGIQTTIKALSSSASQLPAIPFEKPDRLVARDTVNAIKSGFFYGWISLVDGIIEKIENEYNEDFKVIMTGGLSGRVARSLKKNVVVDDMLSLKGVKYIYDLNRENS